MNVPAFELAVGEFELRLAAAIERSAVLLLMFCSTRSVMTAISSGQLPSFAHQASHTAFDEAIGHDRKKLILAVWRRATA